MKHFCLLLPVFLVSQSIQAQWTTSGTNIYNSNSGNVGIGTSTPTASLEIANAWTNSLHVATTGNRTNTVAQILASSAVVGVDNTSMAESSAVAWDFFNNNSSPSWAGTMIRHYGTAMTGTTFGVATSNLGALVFQNVANGVIASNGGNIFISPLNTVSACFLTNGNVGIGTTDPKGYKLAVNGPAIFTQAVVKLNANWPDYVFKKEYRLPSLDSVAQFIEVHNRLPDIPSADSIEATGLNLGANQAALLKKIQELTLYLIRQSKEIEQQKERIIRLEKLAVQKNK